jgi:hypothetical protein
MRPCWLHATSIGAHALCARQPNVWDVQNRARQPKPKAKYSVTYMHAREARTSRRVPIAGTIRAIGMMTGFLLRAIFSG